LIKPIKILKKPSGSVYKPKKKKTKPKKTGKLSQNRAKPV
jgi:hypothetical protein